MGALLKFFLIVGVIAYLFYKIGSFFFRAGAASQQLRNFEEQQRKGFNTNSNGASATKKKKESKVDGGEYVDYEEVK